MKILCPFHDDLNASFLIDIQAGKWFCFGCQKGGGAFELVQAAEVNKSEMQVWQKLFAILKKSGQRPKKIYKPATEEELLELEQLNLSKAQDYYYNLPVLDWTETRGKIRRYFLERGFYSYTLNKAGAKLTYNDNYPVVFPLRDSGVFKGWVSRTIDPEVEKERKYLYNRGFRRSKCLIGNYKNKTVFIVEGYLDYLKARQAGIKYVCASLGWKCSLEQIEKMQQAGVKKIICGLDNDKHGDKGHEFLKLHFKTERFLYPPRVKDFGELSTEQAIKIIKKYGGVI